MKLLENKVSIITGATRGIGKGIAELFADQGSHVIFTYVSSDEKARELEAELEAKGVKHAVINSMWPITKHVKTWLPKW